DSVVVGCERDGRFAASDSLVPASDEDSDESITDVSVVSTVFASLDASDELSMTEEDSEADSLVDDSELDVATEDDSDCSDEDTIEAMGLELSAVASDE